MQKKIQSVFFFMINSIWIIIVGYIAYIELISLFFDYFGQFQNQVSFKPLLLHSIVLILCVMEAFRTLKRFVNITNKIFNNQSEQ
ncbi:MAG: hypothetical protein ACOYMA_02030 [Bacteroidia bacterium]